MSGNRHEVQNEITDTLGIGGIMRGLHTVPVLWSIAADMADLYPNATLLQYVNPMAINTRSLAERFPKLKPVGLCHSVQNRAQELAHDLDINQASVRYKVAGVNHVAFFLLLEQDMGGEDLIDQFNIPLDEYPMRCVEQVADWKQQAAAMMASGSIEVCNSHKFASELMNAIVTDTPYLMYGNLPNHGQIPQLQTGAAVETPCLVDANDVQPSVITGIPPQLAALMPTQINVQELTVRALVDEKPELIYHAAMMDPHTAAELDIRQIRSMVDDLLNANGDWLPEWTRAELRN